MRSTANQEFEAGSYLIRVKASGTALASGNQSVTITAFVPGKETTPSATFTATGADTGTLASVADGMKYKIGEADWTDITGSDDISLTGLSAGTIQVVKKGNGTTTVDSDPQTITVSKAETPNLTVTQPTVIDGKGTVATTTAHEYSSDSGSSWTACTANQEFAAGTYLICVKASGTALASGNQTVTIKAFISATVTFKVVNGSWNEGEGEAATADKTVTLTGYEGDTLKLSADQIPAVGSKPNDTYKAGSWDMTPSTDTAITGATTYTYTYAQKETISQTVTFKIRQAAVEAVKRAATGQTSPATILQFLDFSMYKKVGTDAAEQIHQTKGKVSLTVDIPEDQQAEGRIFFVARVHGDDVEIIGQGTGKSVDCASDLFSTYALMYVDTPKQEEPKEDTIDTLLATLLSGGEDTLNLMWTTVPDAAGYEVFFGKSRPKYVATVTGNSYTFTGLKKGASYKAYVKAAGQTSPIVLCYTDKANIPGSNPAQVTLYDTEITVTISKYAKIRSAIRRPAGTKGRYSRRRLYVSSDPSVATVTRGGRVKGVSKGECTVYVMNNNGVWKGVKVVVDTQPTKVGFKKARRLMKVGESQTIAVKLTPKQAETILTWQTSDPNVATVDETGTVTAAGEGRATITATAENGKAATVNIRVKGFAVSANETPEDDDALPLEVQLNEPEA